MKSQTKAAYLDTVFDYIPTSETPDFWVITACNPGGRTADPVDNIMADKRLRAEIGKLKITPFRVIGRSRDATHAERGWGIPCDEVTAIEIGRRYRQQAVFHFSSGRIDLVDCKSGKRESLDDPSSRILDPREVRHFTLFVGSASDRRKLDPMEYAGVCTRTGALFPAFTIQRAEGCFQSRFEDALLIQVATREPQKVIALAHDLRCFLSQDGIGISHHGIYQRVTDWSDDTLIFDSFSLPPYLSHPG